MSHSQGVSLLEAAAVESAQAQNEVWMLSLSQLHNLSWLSPSVQSLGMERNFIFEQNTIGTLLQLPEATAFQNTLYAQS